MLEVGVCHVFVDPSDTEGGYKMSQARDNSVPGGQQAADLGWRYLDNGHWGADGESPDSTPADDTCGVEGRDVGCEDGDELPDGPGDDVYTQRPQTTDTVVEEEGKTGTDGVAQIHEALELANGPSICGARYAEVMLEAGRRGYGGGRTLVPGWTSGY